MHTITAWPPCRCIWLLWFSVKMWMWWCGWLASLACAWRRRAFTCMCHHGRLTTWWKMKGKRLSLLLCYGGGLSAQEDWPEWRVRWWCLYQGWSLLVILFVPEEDWPKCRVRWWDLYQGWSLLVILFMPEEPDPNEKWGDGVSTRDGVCQSCCLYLKKTGFHLYVPSQQAHYLHCYSIPIFDYYWPM